MVRVSQYSPSFGINTDIPSRCSGTRASGQELVEDLVVGAGACVISISTIGLRKRVLKAFGFV